MSDGHTDCIRWSSIYTDKQNLIKQKLEKTYIMLPGNEVLPLSDIVLLYSEEDPDNVDTSGLYQTNKCFTKNLSELVGALIERGLF